MDSMNFSVIVLFRKGGRAVYFRFDSRSLLALSSANIEVLGLTGGYRRLSLRN